MSEQEIKVPDLGGADEVEVIEVGAYEQGMTSGEPPQLIRLSERPSTGNIADETNNCANRMREHLVDASNSQPSSEAIPRGLPFESNTLSPTKLFGVS